ncbi:Zn(II)2Cys6 transcription factor, partial [Aspergillus brunneoviolaceus CBS 621.78]
ARRVKCDETPGACDNCTRTGRQCEYDLHRIPERARVGSVVAPAAQISLPWKMTSDERRCLSFFQHRSVPHLVAFFDSPLWQRLILQLCHHEPAVFHAVIALGAMNQAYEIEGGRRQRQNQWYSFAVEQASRAISKLNERRQSADPHFQRVILACCLLFVMCELLHQNPSRATFHLQCGLHILRGMNVRRQSSSAGLTFTVPDGPNPYPVEECVVDAFLGLQMCAIFYGTKYPLHFDTELVYHQPYHGVYLHGAQAFRDWGHARQILTPLLDTMALFVAESWYLRDAEIAARYAALHHRQHRLLAYFTRYLHLFHEFCHGTLHPRITLDHEKLTREAHITRLSCLYSLLAIKIALFSKERPLPPPPLPRPRSARCLLPDFLAVLTAAEAAIARFPMVTESTNTAGRPAVTARPEIVPALCVATMRCPDFGLRCRGLAALRGWDAQEAFMGAAFNADLIEEVMKVELLVRYRAGEESVLEGVRFEMGMGTGRKTGEQGRSGSGSGLRPAAARIGYRGSDGVERAHCVVLVRNEATGGGAARYRGVGGVAVCAVSAAVGSFVAFLGGGGALCPGAQ